LPQIACGEACEIPLATDLQRMSEMTGMTLMGLGRQNAFAFSCSHCHRCNKKHTHQRCHSVIN
jgi:hypothetical protein